MYGRNFADRHRPVFLSGLAALLSITLAGCETTGELQRANLERDAGTCADFGAHYGSPEHSDCMLVQQRRRDTESLEALERGRLSSEIARNNLEMLDRQREPSERKKERQRSERRERDK